MRRTGETRRSEASADGQEHIRKRKEQEQLHILRCAGVSLVLRRDCGASALFHSIPLLSSRRASEQLSRLVRTINNHAPPPYCYYWCTRSACVCVGVCVYVEHGSVSDSNETSSTHTQPASGHPPTPPPCLVCVSF